MSACCNLKKEHPDAGKSLLRNSWLNIFLGEGPQTPLGLCVFGACATGKARRPIGPYSSGDTAVISTAGYGEGLYSSWRVAHTYLCN
jgi:hypothetical protein